MERRESYATSPATADGGNIRALPIAERRGFTQADNAYFDGLFGRVSPAAYYCLMYVVRNTLGYHREGVRLSFKQLGDALGLSRNTAMKGLQELEAAHILGSDGADRGRTQIRTYVLLPIEGWTLDTPAATSAENEQVETSPNSALVVSKIALVAAQTSPNFGHPINKERKKVSKESVPDGTATAASAAHPSTVAPTSQGKPTPKRAPKFSGEEQRYVRELVEAVRAHLKLRQFPTEAKERDAAHWFYTAGADGQPVPVADVLACYELTKRDPYWQGKFLSLQKLKTAWAAYTENPAAYRRGVEANANPSAERRAAHPSQQPTRQPPAFRDARTIAVDERPAPLPVP